MKHETEPSIPGYALPDLGARICDHEHRIHALGGGMFVCFACWLRLLVGRRIGARQ